MRLVATLTLLISTLFLALPVTAADSPEERAIAARQGMMDIRAFSLAPLIGMLKGEIPYDAKRANKLAHNLTALLDLKMAGAWTKGTSTDQYPDKTNALPAIWAPDSEFRERGKDFVKAAKQLASVAGQGFEAFAPAAKDLAQACKACHDDYRAEE